MCGAPLKLGQPDYASPNRLPFAAPARIEIGIIVASDGFRRFTAGHDRGNGGYDCAVALDVDLELFPRHAGFQPSFQALEQLLLGKGGIAIKTDKVIGEDRGHFGLVSGLQRFEGRAGFSTASPRSCFRASFKVT